MTIPRGFTRCDECEGTALLVDWGAEPSAAFDYDQPERPCPSCSGSGLVPTEKLRREATGAIEDVGPDEPLETYADAVLRKVAEHVGEDR